MSPTHPRSMLNKKMHLASEVMAILECKTTVRRENLEKTIKSANRTKELLYKVHRKDVVYGLVAHSHSWKGDKDDVVEKVSGQIAEASERHVQHPNNSLDFVCIADLGSWLLRVECDEDAYGPPGIATRYSGPPTGKLGPVTGKTGKPVADIPAVGSTISYVLRRLAYQDERYWGMAEYFISAGMQGVGESSSTHLRRWTDHSSTRREISVFY